MSLSGRLPSLLFEDRAKRAGEKAGLVAFFRKTMLLDCARAVSWKLHSYAALAAGWRPVRPFGSSRAEAEHRFRRAGTFQIACFPSSPALNSLK